MMNRINDVYHTGMKMRCFFGKINMSAPEIRYRQVEVMNEMEKKYSGTPAKRK